MKLTDFTEVVKIEKGWSHEQKYKVTNGQGESFLLRITPIEQYEYKKTEFENMKIVSELGIPMAKGNPQSEAFWIKNGFVRTGVEDVQERYTVVVMERQI